MAIKIIPHYNYTAGSMSASTGSGNDFTIYCKRAHTLKTPTADDCNNCPYFHGYLNGEGYECVWEDVNPVEVDFLEIYPKDKEKELMRVSKLIDRGLLNKG